MDCKMEQDTSTTMAHHEVAADALASDVAGLELLRAAAAAAHAAAAAIIPTADQPRGNIALAAEWPQNYFDQPIDSTAYDAMADDTTRTPLFAAAIQRRLKGQVGWTVLDIGTGPHCLLALIAARAGARRVYAISPCAGRRLYTLWLVARAARPATAHAPSASSSAAAGPPWPRRPPCWPRAARAGP